MTCMNRKDSTVWPSRSSEMAKSNPNAKHENTMAFSNDKQI